MAHVVKWDVVHEMPTTWSTESALSRQIDKYLNGNAA